MPKNRKQHKPKTGKRGRKKNKPMSAQTGNGGTLRPVVNHRKKHKRPRATAAKLVTTECIRKFAVALSDPWSEAALGACLPIEPVRPSRKVRFRTVVTVTVGTAGTGFILVSPSMGSDSPCAYYTTSAFVESFLKVTYTPSLTTGIVQIQPNTLPYTGNQLINESQYRGISARIVSVGLKAQHSSPALTRQGLWWTYNTPDHSDLVGLSQANMGLGNNQGAVAYGIDKQQVKLVSGPVDYDEHDFHCPFTQSLQDGSGVNAGPLTYPWSNGQWLGKEVQDNLFANNGAYGACPMGLGIFGGVPGQTFMVDLVYHLEFAGRSVASVTTSHSDEVAAKIILSAQKEENSAGRDPSAKSLLGSLKDRLATSTTRIVSRAAGAMADAAIGSVFRGMEADVSDEFGRLML